MTDSEKLDLILNQMTSMQKDMTSMQNQILALEQKFDFKFDYLERKIDSIKLTLENVTNKNIQIVAENHIDLANKLNDALKVENQKEMMIIKINILEDEVRRIKERLDQNKIA